MRMMKERIVLGGITLASLVLAGVMYFRAPATIPQGKIVAQISLDNGKTYRDECGGKFSANSARAGVGCSISKGTIPTHVRAAVRFEK